VKDQDLALYRQMKLIRRAEEKIRDRYHENEMKTPVHLCVGQEGAQVGVCAALAPEDQVFGTYRNHGLYLARTNDPVAFFAELYGRASSPAKGKAGSMHLASPAHGMVCTSAVVGTTIPVAVGAAWANKHRKNGRMVAVFFGDGAIDEGVFFESVNYAALERLPVIFVCEDNGLAIHAHAHARHGYDAIGNVIAQFRCHVATSESSDPAEIEALAAEAIAQHKETGRPAFLHLKCHRYLEHVGIAEDYDAGYRSRGEYEEWLAKDSIALVRARLISNGTPKDALDAIDRAIDASLDEAIALARKAPFPTGKALHEDVFA
jgi:TPP-dependent pyruvate/acetoin dehydrogenase alpha subunit